MKRSAAPQPPSPGQRAVLLPLLAAAAAGAAPFVGGDASPLQWRAPQPMPLLGWLLWLVLVVCALYTVRTYRQRLLALVVIDAPFFPVRPNEGEAVPVPHVIRV